jgi:hypothetical protein
MTVPEDPRKPTPNDPQNPTDSDPVVAGPAEPEPPTPPEQAPSPISPATPPTPARTEPAEEPGRRTGQTVTALLAGVGTLANKVRTAAPKKVREAREKRVAGRRVILTEVDGRQVAIGPYSNDAAARQDTVRVSGAPHVVELLSQTAYFGTQDSESGTPRP